MRWQDMFGFGGLGLVVLGTVLMVPGSAQGMRWAYLLGGSLMWVVGFTTVSGWLAWRWSTSQPAREGRSDSTPSERRRSDRRSKHSLAA